jgi:DNA-binding NarL/FixJ family response regulator
MQHTQALLLLEIAYDLADSSRDAMRRIARVVTSAIPRGPVAVACFGTGTRIDRSSVEFERADDDYISRFFEWQRALPLAIRELHLALAPGLVDHRSGAAPLPPELEAMVRRVSPMCVIANTGDERGIHILLGDSRAREWPSGQLHYLREVAQHLATAWRLRTALGAVDGQAPAARDGLRRAMTAREPSRTGRPVAGCQRLWQAVLAGQWSLLDVFAAADTRYIVAYSNPVVGMALRALDPRERSVLELSLDGHSGKWISLELQLCESTVARTLRTALRRIGVTDTADLVGVRDAVFEPVEDLVAGVGLAVARLTRAAATPHLSDAERAIVTSIVGGKRAGAIARERGTSPRTVRNQLASMYRKLGVSSRREVLALFA